MISGKKGFWVLFLLSLCLQLPACITTTQGMLSDEAIVLRSGVEIPCEIVEIGDDFIFFDAEIRQDQYTFGDQIAIGEVEFVRRRQKNDFIYIPIEKYIFEGKREYDLGEPSAATEAEPALENESIAEEQNAILADEFRRMKSDDEQETGKNEAARSQIGLSGLPVLPEPGMNDYSIGIKLSADQLLKSDEKAEADLSQIVDLIVLSGAGGLILYRAGILQAKEIKLGDSQASLVQQLKVSEAWSERKRGLLSAHKTAARSFEKGYREHSEAIAQALGYRSRTSTPFIHFILYLHQHGGHLSPKKQSLLKSWFGNVATNAIRDVLANFDDWYYLAALQLEDQ